MPYDETAQEFVYGYYARGFSADKALPLIRLVYPGFARRTWESWVKRFDWPQRRALADAKRREFDYFARNAHTELLLDLNEIRKNLSRRLDEKIDAQTVHAFTSVSTQIINLIEKNSKNQDPRRVAMEVLKLAFESLIAELKLVHGLGAAMKRNAGPIGRIAQKLAERYGRA